MSPTDAIPTWLWVLAVFGGCSAVMIVCAGAIVAWALR